MKFNWWDAYFCHVCGAVDTGLSTHVCVEGEYENNEIPLGRGFTNAGTGKIVKKKKSKKKEQKCPVPVVH